MTTYIYPTVVRAISDDFAAHVARGSVNPGTDYETPMGTDVVSVASGVVENAYGQPDGSGGRRIHINHDDGTGADYLHLNALSVSTGDRVAQGKRIGFSGASGSPSGAWNNNGYGPHLHISFRRNHNGGYSGIGNIDFDAMMTAQNGSQPSGGGTPIPPASPHLERITAMALPDLVHQVNMKNTDQAYYMVNLFTIDAINEDYAAALLKAQGKGIKLEAIQIINENDMVAVRASINANRRAMGWKEI